MPSGDRRSPGSAAARSRRGRAARAASAGAASSATAWRAAACVTSTSTTLAPPESTSAFVNFCLPIAPQHRRRSTSRRYALKAQPKSEICTPVKRRSMPLIRREGSVRPQESRRALRRPLATSYAALDGGEQAGDVLGRVLEVAVHRHDDLAARPREPRVHGRVLAEVPLEPDGAHAGVAGVQALELGERPVRRPVVDEDQLVRPAERVERRDRAAVELVQRADLVEERDDDRELRSGAGLGDRREICLRHSAAEPTAAS